MTQSESGSVDLRGKRATSVDVAKLAGVSRSTVSSVLNGNGGRFPVATQEKVRRAALELRYSPSLAGRSLKNGRSSTVVMLLPNTTFGVHLQDAVDAVMADLDAMGGNVVIRLASDDQEKTVSAIEGMEPLAVINLGVLKFAEVQRLESHGVVVVPSAGVVALGTEVDGGIARIQAEAALRKGPRSLWFAPLYDEHRDPYGPARFEALREYCSEHGLPQPNIVRVRQTLEGGVQALNQVMSTSTNTKPAILCYNDDIAITLAAAARELAIRIPEDVSLVGVDLTPYGQLMKPRLTTVDTDLRWYVGLLAADLRAQLRGESLKLDTLKTKFDLVQGETT